MQIGSGEERLPGSAPSTSESVSADASVAPPTAVAPDVQQPKRAVWSESGKKTLIWLVVVLLLVATAGGLFLTGWGAKGVAGASSAVAGMKPVFARLVASIPGMEAAPTNTAVVLTPTQRKIVSDYSPVVPIKETRRVKDLVRNHVAGENSEDTNNTAGAAGATAKSVEVANPPVAAHATPALAKATAARMTNRTEAANAVPWPDIQVTATIGGANAKKWLARINGQLVSAGESVNGVKVIAVTSDGVTLELNGEQRIYHVGSRR